MIAQTLFREALKDGVGEDQHQVAAFVFAARKDLGDTLSRYIQIEIDRALPPLDEDN